MSRLDVAELESRVRRRLAVTQHHDGYGGGPSDAKKGQAGFSNASSSSLRSSERRLPTDGGAPLPKAALDVRLVAKACDGISIFKTLRREDRTRLYEQMYQIEYAPGERIVRQGEEGRNFYVVVDGHLNLTVNDEAFSSQGTSAYTSHHPHASSTSCTQHKVVKSLSPGETFGEVSLLHSVPRSATVAAAGGRVKLWALDRVTFKKILSKAAFERRELNFKLLRRVEILDGLDDYGLKLLADACGSNVFTAGDTIFRQNVLDESTKFHIIEKGTVSIRLANGGEVNRLKQGSYFGEVSVLNGTAPTASVIATTDVTTLSLDRAAFKRMLGDDVLSAMARYAEEYAYDEDVTADFRKAGNPKAKPSAKQQLRDTFAVGVARRAADPTGRRQRAEQAMRRAAEQERDEAAVFMRWTQSFSNIPSRDVGSFGNHDKPSSTKTVRSTIAPSDLTFHKELGVGMSGSVYLAKVKDTSAICCVKVMRKKKLLRLAQAENINRELRLSKSFAHDTNFIMQSLCSFQNETHLFLAMEFMPGGDLFQLLVHGTGNRGAFATPVARFYGSEVFLALEFLHARSFVYRDLKPENVLVAKDGHIKLADLGFCKKVEKGERTYTTCGTSDYMAPEVMLSQGYDQSVDVWAFGVFVFELLAGYAPFKAETDSKRHKRILSADLKFKADFQLNAKDLVGKLCVVDISKRLGCTLRGLDDIKDHPFWEVDWDLVASRQQKPPLLPEMKDPARLVKLPPVKGVGEKDRYEKIGETLSAAENLVFAEYF